MDREYTWNIHAGSDDTFRCAACGCYSPNKIGKILYDDTHFGLVYKRMNFCPNCGLEIRKSEKGEKICT